MKTVKILLLGMIVSYATIAQDIPASSVPAVVRNAFQKRFPKAADVEWEMKGSLYEADFEIGNLLAKDHTAQFDASGRMVRHEQNISTSELPATVKNSIKRQFAGYRIDDADKIDYNGKLTWKVELDNGQQEREVILDKSGKVIEDIMS